MVLEPTSLTLFFCIKIFLSTYSHISTLMSVKMLFILIMFCSSSANESFGSTCVVIGLFFNPRVLINLLEKETQEPFGKAILCAASVPVAPENFANKSRFFNCSICLESRIWKTAISFPREVVVAGCPCVSAIIGKSLF